MTTRRAWTAGAVARLTPVCGEREATSVVRILCEDLGIPEGDLDDLQLEILEQAMGRLEAGEPVQYVTGTAFFLGYRLQVGPGVLIPRPETEEWVHRLLGTYRRAGRAPVRVIDIGTGSGCIAIALALAWEKSQVTAVDKSPDALGIAAVNADSLQARVQFIQSDFLDDGGRQVYAGPWDLVVSNPPYIPYSEKVHMDSSVKEFEPEQALYTGDAEGLAFYRSLAGFGKAYLAGEGAMVVELNALRAEEIRDLFEREGYSAEVWTDLYDQPRTLYLRHGAGADEKRS